MSPCPRMSATSSKPRLTLTTGEGSTLSLSTPSIPFVYGRSTQIGFLNHKHEYEKWILAFTILDL